MENPVYLRFLRSLLDAVLVPDLAPCDLTVAALGIKNRRAAAQVLAREPGVAAGLEEYAYLLRHRGLKITFKREDGDFFQTGARDTSGRRRHAPAGARRRHRCEK